MRHLTFVRSAALVAVVTLFSACSSDSNGPDFDGTISSDDAWDAAFDVRYMTEDAVDGLNYGEPNISFAPIPVRAGPIAHRGHRASARPHLTVGKGGDFAAQLSSMVAEGCTTTATGTGEGLYDPIDLNENDVPDDYHVKVSCVETYLDGEVEYTDRDEWEVRVKERTGDLFGWDASLAYKESTHGSDGDWWEEGYAETRKLVINSDGATTTYQGRDWDNGEEEGTPWRWEWNGSFALDFAPDGEISLGSYLPDGEISLSGRYRLIDSDGANIDFQLVSIGGVHFSAGCWDEYGQPLTDGQVVGRLNGDPNVGFTILWLGCDEGTYIDVYGTDDDDGPPPPSAPASRYAPLARPMAR